MATLLKVLNNLADIKSAGGVAPRVRTQGPSISEPAMAGRDFDDMFRPCFQSSRTLISEAVALIH
jgi:hypothetical protein